MYCIYLDSTTCERLRTSSIVKSRTDLVELVLVAKHIQTGYFCKFSAVKFCCFVFVFVVVFVDHCIGPSHLAISHLYLAVSPSVPGIGHCHPAISHHHPPAISHCIGAIHPALGGTVLNLTAMSRCPALPTFYPTF